MPRFTNLRICTSVADPDPGSGIRCLFEPGSGMGKKQKRSVFFSKVITCTGTFFAFLFVKAWNWEANFEKSIIVMFCLALFYFALPVFNSVQVNFDRVKLETVQ